MCGDYPQENMESKSDIVVNECPEGRLMRTSNECEK